ncbi:MAG: TIGR04255 family protein [Nitrospirae bacterium]|nr:TIGR04255 family protein [Nitrospirota bacterium]
MSDYPVFPNAPITEALIDIRVQLPEEINLDKLKTFHESIKERFPQKQERISIQAGFKFTPEGSATLPPSSKPDGYLFRSMTENKVVQARLDGFTFNKLKPYEKWELFRNEAHVLWDSYFKIAKPIKVLRIALRYINRIELPLSITNFKEYILTTPEIAPKLPQGLAHFFMQLVIPNHEIAATATITQTIENPLPAATHKFPYIFDIDVWKDTLYEGSNQEMWDEFEKLHIFKNEIFFNSITKKTEELFK